MTVVPVFATSIYVRIDTSDCKADAADRLRGHLAPFARTLLYGQERAR